MTEESDTHGDDATREFRLRYVGTRFANARMPVTVLADLPAFRDLVLAFAKQNWLARHPDRKRLPKGFDQALSLDLIDVGEGSAIPVMEWQYHQIQQMLPGFREEMIEVVDESFGNIIQLFDKKVPEEKRPQLGPGHVKALNKFGSSLKDGERIEFSGTPRGDDNVVYLDTEIRRKVITGVKGSYETRTEGFGVLSGTHADGRLFINTEKFGEFCINVDPVRIRDEFDGNLESGVQFDVTIELDQNNALRAVKDVHDVALFDQNPLERCLDRLEAIRQLPPGWFDGEGEKIDNAVIDSVVNFIKERSAYAPLFRIYPDVEGGVLIEFKGGDWDVSLEFRPDQKIEIVADRINGDESNEKEVSSVDELVSEFDRLDMGFVV